MVGYRGWSDALMQWDQSFHDCMSLYWNPNVGEKVSTLKTCINQQL